MPKSRIPSPARSQSAIVTPRRAKPRGPRSVGSPARSNTSVRLTSVIQNFKDKNMDSFHLSPLHSRRSVLNDNTDIEEPKCNSWWKKLNDTSRDIMEVLDNDKQEERYNVMEELMDVEVLSQEKKNPTLDLQSSSDNDSISSIVIPHRKLFSQKENQPQPQKKFAQFLGPRESMAKLNKTSGASDKSEKTIVAGTKKLFGQSSKPRSKPAFPTELLKFSPDKSVNKTAGEIKGQVRNLFGNRAGVKRKNNFADFIASESEEEPEIQPKVFGFQKKTDVPSRRFSTASKSSRGNRDHSPTSSVTTDIDIEDWKMLPSSTMVQPQLEAMMIDSPAKKARLSKLSEGKESDAATNNTTITNKTKQSNKSNTSKNKSKMSISKNSNKYRTSPKRNDEENIKEIVINEEMPEHIDQQEENEVSLHYSDDEPQEDNLDHKNDHDVNNKTNRSNKSAASNNKSKTSISIHKSVRSEENDNKGILNKSKDKYNGKVEKETDQVVDKELPDAQCQIQEMVDENQISDVEKEIEDNAQESEEDKESQEIEDENHGSEVEQEDLQENESQEIDDENHYSEVELEDQQENESEEMEDENQDSVDEREENESQEIEDENQDSEVEQEMEVSEVEPEDEGQENVSQNADSEAPVDNDKETESHQPENGNRSHEIQNLSNVTTNKTELPNQPSSGNRSRRSSLMNKSKTSSKTNVSENIKATILNKELDCDERKIELDNDGDNLEQNNDEDITNKSKHGNESLASKNKSKLCMSKNIMNKTNNSPNKSVTSINKSTSKSLLTNRSKTSHRNSKNEIVHKNIIDEDQIDAENCELGIEQEEILENENQEIVDQDHLSKDGEEEEEMDEENESQEIVNESQEVEDDEEGNEEYGDNNDEEQSECEDAVNQSQEVDDLSNEIDNDRQEVDESQETENESQEVHEDEEAEESENEEVEETEIEEENKSQEEMDEDIDQQESNESVEESDGQNDAEYDDNHRSQEEISGTDEGTPNVTHDTTGRNRKKNETNLKSPEAILHDNTNQMESFTAKGRNTSVRRTSMIKSLNIRPSLAPPRDSTGLSDGTKNSSAEGSGWDSHRVTKKTLRQTFGRDFTPRKSLRALVMEKSAKRHTEFNVNDVDMPRANSTELPEDTRYEMEVDPHEVSKRTRQTTLEMYLQKIKKQNMEKRMKMEEEVRNSLKAPSREFSNPLTMPSRPFALKRAKPVQTKPKTKAVKTTIPLDDLPQELIEDMKYKPPRRFQPSNASWITKRLYKFLESKLEAKYDYKARIRAEKLVETIYNFTKELRRHSAAPGAAVELLKHEMARLDVVRTHFDFYQFFHDYMPREVRVKVNPDVVNKIPLPRQGVFTDILRGNTVQG